MRDTELTERQLDRVRGIADGTDIAFIATFTKGGSFTGETFNNDIDALEGMALASFLRSYARDLEDNIEMAGALGEEL